MKKTDYVALEGSSEKYFDYLTLGGKQYSGNFKGKKVKVKGLTDAKWTADFWEGTKGWKFCKASAPRLKIVPKKPKKVKGKGKGKGKGKAKPEPRPTPRPRPRPLPAPPRRRAPVPRRRRTRRRRFRRR